jgi:hypothetical protein
MAGRRNPVTPVDGESAAPVSQSPVHSEGRGDPFQAQNGDPWTNDGTTGNGRDQGLQEEPPEDDEDDDDDASLRRKIEELKKKKSDGFQKPRANLGSIRMEEFTGSKGKYRLWKKTVKAQATLYKLEDEETALLIYLSTKHDARDALDVLEVEEMCTRQGLKMIWRLLDEAYDQLDDERFEEKEESFQTHRRTPGMSMERYIRTFKRLKVEYLQTDPDTTFSEKFCAQRLLNRAGLRRTERHDVFYKAGASYTFKGVEAVLRRVYSKVEETDQKQGRTYGKEAERRHGDKKVGEEKKPPTRKFFRKRGTHVAGEAGDEENPFESGDESEDPGLSRRRSR